MILFAFELSDEMANFVTWSSIIIGLILAIFGDEK
jgi:hypothetical protein